MGLEWYFSTLTKVITEKKIAKSIFARVEKDHSEVFQSKLKLLMKLLIEICLLFIYLP